MNPQEYPWEDSERNLYEFEELLKYMKIKIGHSLEEEFLSVMEICAIHRGEMKYDQSRDYRKAFRVAGLNDLIRKILLNKDKELFDKISNHLPLLVKSATVSLSDSSSKDDESHDKLLELYIALSVIGSVTNLELDSKSSRGKNPDIIFDYKNIKWAIACKSLHSRQIKGLRQQIESGVSQIDKSDVQKGIVIVNISNVIDHDKSWGISVQNGIADYDYYKEDIAKSEFYLMASRVSDSLGSEIQESDIELIFGKSKAIPYVLGFFSTVTGLIRHDGSRGPALLRLLYPLINREVDNITNDTLKMINNGLHDQI